MTDHNSFSWYPGRSFLSLPLIYGGKTQYCHPVYDFPDNWCVTHSENHWSNKEIMIKYIQGIIVPYVEGVQQMLGKNNQAALAIFDNFRGQLTENVAEELECYNIQSVLVPVKLSQLHRQTSANGFVCK